jgi:L-lactate dehydrogenase (cytochrome)
MSVKQPKQHLIFQLYLNKNRAASEKLIRGLESDGFSAIMLTVDAAMPGKRELDQRTKGDWEGPGAGRKAVMGEGEGIGQVSNFRLRPGGPDSVLSEWNA